MGEKERKVIWKWKKRKTLIKRGQPAFNATLKHWLTPKSWSTPKSWPTQGQNVIFHFNTEKMISTSERLGWSKYTTEDSKFIGYLDPFPSASSMAPRKTCWSSLTSECNWANFLSSLFCNWLKLSTLFEGIFFSIRPPPGLLPVLGLLQAVPDSYTWRSPAY